VKRRCQAKLNEKGLREFQHRKKNRFR